MDRIKVSLLVVLLCPVSLRAQTHLLREYIQATGQPALLLIAEEAPESPRFKPADGAGEIYRALDAEAQAMLRCERPDKKDYFETDCVQQILAQLKGVSTKAVELEKDDVVKGGLIYVKQTVDAFDCARWAPGTESVCVRPYVDGVEAAIAMASSRAVSRPVLFYGLIYDLAETVRECDTKTPNKVALGDCINVQAAQLKRVLTAAQGRETEDPSAFALVKQAVDAFSRCANSEVSLSQATSYADGVEAAIPERYLKDRRKGSKP